MAPYCRTKGEILSLSSKLPKNSARRLSRNRGRKTAGRLAGRLKRPKASRQRGHSRAQLPFFPDDLFLPFFPDFLPAFFFPPFLAAGEPVAPSFALPVEEPAAD